MFRKLGQGGAVGESISPFTMEVPVMVWTLYCVLLNEERTPLARSTFAPKLSSPTLPSKFSQGVGVARLCRCLLRHPLFPMQQLPSQAFCTTSRQLKERDKGGERRFAPPNHLEHRMCHTRKPHREPHPCSPRGKQCPVHMDSLSQSLLKVLWSCGRAWLSTTQMPREENGQRSARSGRVVP